jgi:hypothetical protein
MRPRLGCESLWRNENRFADQEFALTGDDLGVFVGRLEINDIIHADQPDAFPPLRQVRRAAEPASPGTDDHGGVILPGPHLFRKGIDLVPVQGRSRQTGRRNTEKRTTRHPAVQHGFPPSMPSIPFLFP